MAPILGIYASQMSGHLVVPNSYASIATVTVGSGGASSISFNSIPSTYTHLQLRGGFIPTSTDFSAVFRLNGDSSFSNYVAHTLSGNGSATEATNSTSYTPSSLRILYSQDATNSSISAAFVLDILDYANINKYKTSKALAGIDSNGASSSNRISFASGLWMSNSVVNSLTIYSAQGGYGVNLGSSFSQYSTFSLYGVK